jgi:hypothetical protein
MMMKLGLLSLLSMSYSTEAFVTPQSGFAIHKKQQSMPMPSQLHMLDPSHVMETASTLLSDASTSVKTFAPEEGGISYSKASYYTVLGLYALSFPGLWSQIKRSTKAKVKRKEFVTPGEKASPEGITLRQQAGEIMAYMKANNYDVIEAGETIKFRGIVSRSVSQAFFLVFCTLLGLLSLALVLQIQFHDLVLPVIGEPNWYALALASPYAGVYYWQSGDRTDDCEVKLATNEEETENEITVEGSDEELERMWRTLGWQEKGMVKIEGLLEKTA